MKWPLTGKYAFRSVGSKHIDFLKSVKVVVEGNDGQGPEGQFKNIHVYGGLRVT